MHTYQEQKFNLPDLKGISPKQLEVHLGLYGGYVKHVNILREKVHELEAADKEGNAYAVAELRRRLGFEFDGMRMHEYYFESFEGGFSEQRDDSPLASALSKKYGSMEKWNEHFRAVGMTRGVGWAVLYFDPRAKTPHVVWVEDHELGTFVGRYLDHPCGGCRMGDDPGSSVVDSWGRTWDHENLFVAGAPTCVSAGCCNGTNTFVALTLRSAEEVGREFPARTA